jgi:hypothetical protein
MSLFDLCKTGKYNTDKFYNRNIFHSHSYIENFYDSKFSIRKETTLNLLEIGIYDGGSLLLWKDFFSKSTIFGIDVAMANLFHDRIYQIKGDAYNSKIVDLMNDSYFDIIIDDGPHTAQSQISFVKQYLSKVNEGGLLICEDIASMDTVVSMISELPSSYRNRVEIIDLRQTDNRYDSLIFCLQK